MTDKTRSQESGVRSQEPAIGSQTHEFTDASVPAGRSCWCGEKTLFPYSSEYDACRVCGTLVSRAAVAASGSSEANSSGLYGESYWLERQREHHHLPDIHQRSRLDLPERCTYWLQHLLSVQLPPARILEVGCGHGAYVALLNWAGFSAVGTEMSPAIVELARKTFDIDVRVGPLEVQSFAVQSFDVIVLNDIIEHLPDPLSTLQAAAKLLKPDGFFVIQTPEYREHLSHADLVAVQDLFLRHMTNNNEEHLYLFSRRSAQELFRRIGFPTLNFLNPIFSYDLFFTAGAGPLPQNSPEAIWTAISARPSGRLVQALLDKAYESNDRQWAIQRLKETKPD